MEKRPSLGENLKAVFPRYNFDGNGDVESDNRAAISKMKREQYSLYKLLRLAKHFRPRHQLAGRDSAPVSSATPHQLYLPDIWCL